MRRLPPLATVLVVALLAGCTSKAPDAAAASPDTLTKMICEDEVREELSGFLGVEPTAPPQASWTDPVFTCVYPYADGKFTMTVWQEPDKAATSADYDKRSADGTSLRGLGEAAATLKDGSIVLRKDTKILLVDVSTLPQQFGKPPLDPAKAALTIAQVVMHCWIETAPSPL